MDHTEFLKFCQRGDIASIQLFYPNIKNFSSSILKRAILTSPDNVKEYLCDYDKSAYYRQQMISVFEELMDTVVRYPVEEGTSEDFIPDIPVVSSRDDLYVTIRKAKKYNDAQTKERCVETMPHSRTRVTGNICKAMWILEYEDLTRHVFVNLYLERRKYKSNNASSVSKELSQVIPFTHIRNMCKLNPIPQVSYLPNYDHSFSVGIHESIPTKWQHRSGIYQDYLIRKIIATKNNVDFYDRRLECFEICVVEGKSELNPYMARIENCMKSKDLTSSALDILYCSVAHDVFFDRVMDKRNTYLEDDCYRHMKEELEKNPDNYKVFVDYFMDYTLGENIKLDPAIGNIHLKADCDLIVDDCIVDIKVKKGTTNGEFRQIYIQLLLYCSLTNLNRAKWINLYDGTIYSYYFSDEALKWVKTNIIELQR